MDEIVDQLETPAVGFDLGTLLGRNVQAMNLDPDSRLAFSLPWRRASGI